MAIVEPNKTQIRKEAKLILAQAVSKQECFELLNKKYKARKVIADVIKNLPSSTAIAKYGVWNNILLGLLIVSAIGMLTINFSFHVVMWFSFLIYSVANKLTKHYAWISLLSLIALIIFSISLSTIGLESIGQTEKVFVFIFVLPALVLPLWLQRRLCPSVAETKEEYLNPEGQKRNRIIYTFPD